MSDEHGTIESHPLQGETYPPSPEFRDRANVNDPSVYLRAAEDPEAYWASEAEKLQWTKPFEEILDWSNPPFAKWFQDGELNVLANCLDRHVAAGLGTGSRSTPRAQVAYEGTAGWAVVTFVILKSQQLLASEETEQALKKRVVDRRDREVQACG